MVSERSQMFARNMTLRLQPNQLMRFIQAYDAAVLSILFSRTKRDSRERSPL